MVQTYEIRDDDNQEQNAMHFVSKRRLKPRTHVVLVMHLSKQFYRFGQWSTTIRILGLKNLSLNQFKDRAGAHFDDVRDSTSPRGKKVNSSHQIRKQRRKKEKSWNSEKVVDPVQR